LKISIRCVDCNKKVKKTGYNQKRCKKCAIAIKKARFPCEHGIERPSCKQCGGSAICEHNRLRSKCPDCFPSGIYNAYRSGSKRRNIQFVITFDDYLKISSLPCTYCGLSFGRNGIDRRDNLMGYTFENSVPCCSKCNFMKHSYAVEEFLNHIRCIYEFQISYKEEN
jgi:hypothetical protein